MDFNVSCNGVCTPPQVINFNIPVNDISDIAIYNDCNCKYENDTLEFAYSLDNVCWSCYMTYNEALTNTIDLNTDFYIRIKIQGVIDRIELNGEKFVEYSTQLFNGFNFSETCTSSNTFNPYANMDCAISLYQQLSETVSCIVGIPCYYIKLTPNQGSKDITFKEYALMDVEAIKQVKIIIQDNEMPSSKPEFMDFGIEFQTDWEVEITKGTFATAFGVTAQPMEGDLVYIPMMKRMWMVSQAYEEKKDGFMWISSTFKLALVKYQEKDSVELGDAQSFVDTVVKNKYEDLFGEDEQQTLDASEATTDSPLYAANNLYPVYESDATRKYITCDSLNIIENNLYFRGTLVSDNRYTFITNSTLSRIIYQKKYCGSDLSISFLIYTEIIENFDNDILKIGRLKFHLKQVLSDCELTFNIDPNLSLKFISNGWYFVVIKWSKSLNTIDAHIYPYVYNQKIPIYKLTNNHYWFDIDNPADSYVGKYNMEFELAEKGEVELNNFYGSITNFKLFDVYNDNVSELLQMYPTHQHLLINDTARRLVDLPGVKPA